MKRIAYPLLCAIAGALLFFLLMPAPKPDRAFALGAQIPAKPFTDELHDIGTRTGIEKISRKEVIPSTHAIAKGAAAPIVDRFLAAAAVDVPTAVSDSTQHGLLTGDAKDSTALPARVGPSGSAGSDSTPHPLLARDTVCVGVGGSQRGKNLTLLSACVPGKDGAIQRFKGSSFDWSYESGRLVVFGARFVVPEWIVRALAFIAGVVGGLAF
jgi:hypothetical protein